MTQPTAEQLAIAFVDCLVPGFEQASDTAFGELHVMRWVRRPLLPVMRLWRRNIQLKVVVTTLLMSLGVVLLLGFVVIGQVRNGLLDAKGKASQSQATGGVAGGQQRGRRAQVAGAVSPACHRQPHQLVLGRLKVRGQGVGAAEHHAADRRPAHA